MNLLSLVGPRLDNIYQIRRKRYYSSGCNFLQSKQGLSICATHACCRSPTCICLAAPLLFMPLCTSLFIQDLFQYLIYAGLGIRIQQRNETKRIRGGNDFVAALLACLLLYRHCCYSAQSPGPIPNAVSFLLEDPFINKGTQFLLENKYSLWTILVKLNILI